MSSPLTPTAHTPLFTASCAYSTWNLPTDDRQIGLHSLWQLLHHPGLILLTISVQDNITYETYVYWDVQARTYKCPSGEKTVMALS